MLAGPAPLAALLPPASPPSSYGQIPWFRQRWALLCIFRAFAPAAGVLAWTDELYYVAGNVVEASPKREKIVITCMAVCLLIAGGSGEEAFQGFVGLVLIGTAIRLSLNM